MKKIIYLFLSVLITIYSCDESTDPNNFFDENANGAWLKTVALASSSLNLNDITSAKFEVTLEEVDEEGGTLLSLVNVYVQYIDNTVITTDQSVAEVFYDVLDASEFDSSTGNPTITHTITANQLVDFLSLDALDLAATDLFVVRYELVLTDGRVFSTINSGTNIEDTTNPFYVSPFAYKVPLVCPVDSSYAIGTYDLTTTIPGVFGTSFQETVEVTVGTAPTKRTFSADWLPGAGFGNTSPYQFDLVCGNVIFDDDQGTGLLCSLGILLSSGDTLTSYDESDDSVILINFTENTQGDCGAGPTQNQIMLTRQ
jgi:hypothetical protein